jgi:hypothetical protein
VLRAGDRWTGRGFVGHRGLAARLPRLSGAENRGVGSSAVEQWWLGCQVVGVP